MSIDLFITDFLTCLSPQTRYSEYTTFDLISHSHMSMRMRYKHFSKPIKILMLRILYTKYEGRMGFKMRNAQSGIRSYSFILWRCPINYHFMNIKYEYMDFVRGITDTLIGYKNHRDIHWYNSRLPINMKAYQDLIIYN